MPKQATGTENVVPMPTPPVELTPKAHLELLLVDVAEYGRACVAVGNANTNARKRAMGIDAARALARVFIAVTEVEKAL